MDTANYLKKKRNLLVRFIDGYLIRAPKRFQISVIDSLSIVVQYGIIKLQELS
jgi:hypothetical protein